MPIGFVDRNKTIRQERFTRRETGYEPTREYYPTYRLVKCSLCGQAGAAEFLGGLNIKEGDRLMDGRPIWGECLHCAKRAELVPLPVDDPKQKELKLYYDIQEALKEAVRRGERLTPAAQIWPLARVRAWEEWKREAARAGADAR